MQDAYKSLGGSGTASNVDEFRRIVEQASPKQVEQAWHDEAWANLLQPLIENGGGPLPTSVTEQVSILFERMHTLFTESGVSSRS